MMFFDSTSLKMFHILVKKNDEMIEGNLLLTFRGVFVYMYLHGIERLSYEESLHLSRSIV
jgi:hypothetical protein